MSDRILIPIRLRAYVVVKDYVAQPKILIDPYDYDWDSLNYVGHDTDEAVVVFLGDRIEHDVNITERVHQAIRDDFTDALVDFGFAWLDLETREELDATVKANKEVA